MASPVNIKFYLEDPQGRKTGRTLNGFMQQIPYADQYGTRSEVNEPNPSPHQQWNEIYTSDSESQIPIGKYKIVVNGNNITTETEIRIHILMEWSNGKSAWVAPVEHIFPNLIYIYEFDVPVIPPANKELIVVKVSNPTDLITDINTLAKANYIGNAKFVVELIENIQEIEKERLKPADKDDKITPAQKAKKEYQELIKELNEKNIKPEKDEYVDGLAVWILQRDLDYIINHIQ